MTESVWTIRLGDEAERDFARIGLFGQLRGVTRYNLMSNPFSGLNGIVVPGALRDSLVLLALLLEQETELGPMEFMTDAAAYSDAVFGLFWLLGYQ